MADSEHQPAAAPAAAAPAVSPRVLALVLIAMAASWGWLMWVAHYYWGEHSYYNFGWFVPFIGAYLVYNKLRDGRFRPAGPPGRTRWALFWAGLVGAVLLVGSSRLFSEANMFWRVPLWTHGLLLLLLSYSVVGLFGGRRSLWWFAFPFFFLLMALPWPHTIELWIIQSLTRLVADLVVVVINLIGYPAVAMGNTIQVADTQVGVDEACSGIRSLQSLLVLGLFLGEFFVFGIGRRLVLLAGAVVLAMGFNGFRAVMLTLVKINGTEEKFTFWHDFLGNFNAIICGLLLFGFAELLAWLFGKGKQKAPVIDWRLASWRPACGAVAAVTIGFALSEAAVEGYYRWHEARAEALPELVIEWPDGENLTYTLQEIPERTREILQFEFGSQVKLRWVDGLEATAVHYGYTGEDPVANLASFGHSPTLCMPSAGAQLREELDSIEIDLYGIKWNVRHFDFIIDQGWRKSPIQVFYLVWEHQQMGIEAERLERIQNWDIRWDLVRHGRRNFGRHVLLVYFAGQESKGEIKQRFRDLIDKIVLKTPKLVAKSN